MRTKAIGTWISFVIIVISIILIVLGFISTTVLVHIGYGVLGSSIVSFVIYFAEYFTSKREALELFYQEAIKIVQSSGRCAYVFISELDRERAELQWKGYCSYVLMDLQEIIPDCREIIDDILIKNNLPRIKNPNYNSLYNSFLEEFSRRDHELIDIMKEYIAFSELDLLPFGNAYGNICYLCDLKRKKNDLYDSIFAPIQEMQKSLRSICFRLKQYVNQTEKNAPIAYDYLDQATKQLYKIEHNENTTIAHAHFYDSMSIQLEKLRCDISHEKYKEFGEEHIYKHYDFISLQTPRPIDSMNRASKN